MSIKKKVVRSFKCGHRREEGLTSMTRDLKIHGTKLGLSAGKWVKRPFFLGFTYR